MPYSKSVALIGSIALASIAQIHGFHRCYVNEWGTGILMCVTLGGCWIWSIVDWLNIGRVRVLKISCLMK